MCVGNHYQSAMKRCTKFIGLLLLPSLGLVATINRAVSTSSSSSLYPSHASNSFLLFRSGEGKEFYFFYRKKGIREARQCEMKKKNFPSLHRAEKKIKKNAIAVWNLDVYGRISERVSTLNCPLVIDLTHFVYCYLFSLAHSPQLAAVSPHKLTLRKMHETHTHTRTGNN